MATKKTGGGQTLSGAAREQFSERIMALIHAAGYATMKDFSEKSGVDKSIMSRVKNGDRGVATPTLRRIAVALGVTVDALFDNDYSRALGRLDVLQPGRDFSESVSVHRASGRVVLDLEVLVRELIDLGDKQHSALRLLPAPTPSFDELPQLFKDAVEFLEDKHRRRAFNDAAIGVYQSAAQGGRFGVSLEELAGQIFEQAQREKGKSIGHVGTPTDDDFPPMGSASLKKRGKKK